MTRRAISTDHAPAAIGPYSQAIVSGGLVFCSGTVGIDPATDEVADGIEAQTEQALTNLAAVLEAGGSSLANVVKATVMYTNLADFPTINAIYARRVGDPAPARSAPAGAQFPRGILISIDAIAEPTDAS
jgi:2-iminobutanoate/2-iminopropanoate deaminase